MRKFVLYSRQSKKSGMVGQMTLETSEFTMQHYLDTLNEPYEIIDIIQEVKSGFKASSRNRVDFNRAVELCKQNNASLLVSNMSRLSRNTAHGAAVLEEIDVVLASAPSANKAMKKQNKSSTKVREVLISTVDSQHSLMMIVQNV